MNKEYFDKEKQQYENIEIPEELDFMVRTTLKEGRRRKRNKVISRASTFIAAIFLAFVLAVNLFPSVAYAVGLIPGLDRLVELVNFDKGLNNAIDEGLAKEVKFEEEQNGITLKVDGLAGDWKKLWVNYSIDDGTDNQQFSNGIPNYSVELEMKFFDENKEEGVSYGTNSLNKDNESYVEIAFPKFIESFILEFKVYKNSGESINIGDERPELNYIATFEVPITLDKNIFNSKLNEVTIDNKIIETPVGKIEIESTQSSKSRIVMAFNLKSNIYDYMSFDNPRLVDDKGNEYKPNGSYRSEDINGNKTIEFAGEIKEGIKSLRFECDGVYYARKDNREIVINLKDKYVEPNDYGFTFVSDGEAQLTNSDIIIIKSNDVQSASFNAVNNENGEPIVEEDGMSFTGIEEEDYTTQCYFKVLDKNAEKVTLNVYWVLKDKTDAVQGELIKFNRIN